MKSLLITAGLVCAIAFFARSQTIPAYTADKLMGRLANKDTTYIVNFWATWCGPCVAELPQFTELQHRYTGQKVKVLLVSFDFPDAYPGKLRTYVEKKKLEPEVVWFSETNATEFIPKIDERWSGALPGTMIIQKKSKIFLERPVKADEISECLKGLGVTYVSGK
jgi:thiol-disulfide isomerase/thioredoxin